MAEPTGLEPAISGVTGRRVNHLHHGSTMVRKKGLEPLQDCSHKALNLARLPIPPLPHNYTGADDRTRTGDPFLTMEVLYLLSYIGIWSGRRVSNSQPSRWQRDALPIELLPHACYMVGETGLEPVTPCM